MKITIRDAKESDANNLITYCNLVGGQTDNLTFGANDFHLTVEEEEKYLQQVGQSPTDFYLVAEQQGEIIGALSCNSIPKQRIIHNSNLGLSIDSDFHNQGIGSRLMKEAIKRCRNSSIIENIGLEVRADNYAAKHLYTKCGFELVGILPRNFKVDNQYIDIEIYHLDVK